MNALGSIHHVALTVSDLEVSERWYREVLGLVEIFREQDEARSAVIFGFEGARISIGLVQHKGTAGQFSPVVIGLDHLGLTVDTPEQMHEWAAHFDALGVEHSGAIDVPPGLILNFKDPDGIALSLFWDRPT